MNSTRTFLAQRLFAIAVATLVCFASLGGMRSVTAEEPYRKFLKELREERLFDLALLYLEDLEQRPESAPELKTEIDLERGLLLYQSAAVLPASSPDRPAKLDQAEAAIRKFLAERIRHPRRGEARLKLGELLLTRAEESKRIAGETDQDIPAAIKFYDDAHRLFEETLSELAAIYETLKGARVDPADTAKVAYRQQLQQDLRQAQLLSAKAVDERARARAVESPQRKADLQQALEMLSHVYTNEKRMIGIRNYALFYRSDIQAELGQADDAIDGFQRIADLENVDILRPLQTSAVTRLVELLVEQEKYPVALDRADQWIANLRPDEQSSAEAIELKVARAKLQQQWAAVLREKDSNDRVAGRLVRAAREQLRALLREPGSHLEEIRELLTQLGVDSAPQTDEALPTVKDFGEALAAAQERLNRSETSAIELEALRLAVQDPQTNTAELEGKREILEQTQAAIDRDQQQAIALLEQALRLYGSDDDRKRLFEARFLLSYALLKQQRPWDGLAVAEFLAYTSSGSEGGQRAAAVALGAYSDLLRTAGEEDQQNLTGQLEPFAEFLLDTWPTAPEAAAAASALVQLALMEQEWDRAQRFLQMVPADSDTARSLRRDAGLTFYARYLEKKSADGEESPATQQLRKLALETLRSGTQQLQAANVNSAAMGALNALVRLLLAEGEYDEATAILLESEASPLAVLRKEAHGISAPAAMETYRTAIQLISGRLAEGNLPAAEAIAQIRDYIQRLQAIAEETPDGGTKLASIFVGIARDLKEQLTATQKPNERKRLSEALVLITAEAAKQDNFNTQFWAADTLVNLAQELDTQSADKALAQQAYADAVRVLRNILAAEKAQPGWIDPPTHATQVQLTLAKALRGSGDYKAAIEVLATILKENASLLDVQMEAAKTYQAWGEAQNPGFHKAAVIGGRPDPKTRQPIIWGFGKISQRTANMPDYTEQFFESRYQLAYSRLRYAGGLKDAEQKKVEIARAEKDIVSTATLYPELGGATVKNRFDSLLKTVQRSLGKSPAGLAALNNK